MSHFPGRSEPLEPKATELPATSTCAACGAPFHCGATDAQCWCAALPPLQPVAGGACLCRRCLEKALAKERT